MLIASYHQTWNRVRPWAFRNLTYSADLTVVLEAETIIPTLQVRKQLTPR